MFIDGRAIAGTMLQTLKSRIETARVYKVSSGSPHMEKRRFPLGAPPKLVAVMIGDDRASLAFLRQKEKVASELGIPFELKRFPITITTELLRNEVAAIGIHPLVGGVVVQLPLPSHIDRAVILDSVPQNKDVDCLSALNLAQFFAGDPRVSPAAVVATKEILLSLGILAPQEKRILVLGFGLLVGRPIAHYLAALGGQVTVLGSKVSREQRAAQIHQADIIICGANVSGLVDGLGISPKTIVIDFGYPPNADAQSVDTFGGIVTPTPGGTGPIVVVALFQNFFALNY